MRGVSKTNSRVWKKVPRRVQACIDEYHRNRLSNKCINILILIPSVNLVFLYRYFGY